MIKPFSLFFSFLTSLSLFAQTQASQDVQNLYNPNYRYITYLGMDFSKVVLIGDFSEALGTNGNPATKNAYFKAWNNLVSGEFDKYNIKALANNKNIVSNIENIMKLNYAANIDSISGYKTPNYTKEEILKHVKTFNLPTNKGLGVFFLIESFNKDITKAFVDFVVINMETKEIVLLKKLEVNPRGSGLRNYWAGAIFEAFKTIEKNFSSSWKSEFSFN
jgi:hypothetical protein